MLSSREIYFFLPWYSDCLYNPFVPSSKTLCSRTGCPHTTTRQADVLRACSCTLALVSLWRTARLTQRAFRARLSLSVRQQAKTVELTSPIPFRVTFLPRAVSRVIFHLTRTGEIRSWDLLPSSGASRSRASAVDVWDLRVVLDRAAFSYVRPLRSPA